MSSTPISKSLAIACLLGGGLGVGLGCPGLPLVPLEPCASGENNHLNGDGEDETPMSVGDIPLWP